MNVESIQTRSELTANTPAAWPTLAERLQVFVSSVMSTENLQRERDAAIDAIKSLKLTVPWAFEYSPAESRPAQNVFLREVAQSDLLVLVVSKSHTDAVQRELETAESCGKHILAFVRGLGTEQPTPERVAVLRWLRDRVKYQYFTDADDLRDKVVESVAKELVRGYREYRITERDYGALFAGVGAPCSLIVRSARKDDLAAIAAVLLELRDLYPEIGAWATKILGEARAAHGEIRLAEVGSEIAGLSISRDKEPGIRKFSTLYVRPGFRGEAIGPHLVYEEMARAARDGVRKAYVTFADELAFSLRPILRRYGFVTEGISSGRYRAGSAEWVLAKTFCYGTLSASEFGDFTDEHLIREFGGVSNRIDARRSRVTLPEHDLLGLPSAESLVLAQSTSANPEDEYEELERELGNERWLFTSLYGRPANADHWSHTKKNWIDGEDLRARFYPLEPYTPAQSSILCTIKPSYADAIIPTRERPTLFSPDRLQIRPDNVYYRSPDRFRTLRRGSSLLFYVSSPEKRLRGSSRIQELLVDKPEECLSRYGSMGIYDFKQLADIASKHAGKVLAVAFDWYQESGNRPSLKDLRTIAPHFNPQSASLVTDAERSVLTGVEA